MGQLLVQKVETKHPETPKTNRFYIADTPDKQNNLLRLDGSGLDEEVCDTLCISELKLIQYLRIRKDI